MDTLSLLELNEYIQRVFALNFQESLWVHFELSNVKHSRGHVYFDCIEKDENSDDILAHQSGAIWRRQLSFIKKKLGKIFDDILNDGVVIAAKVNVEFHPRYGAKLVILDIDPAYTYGQLAMEREKTIERLTSEGLMQLNASIEPALVLQRIAVISNETAAGYKDFYAQMTDNQFGYQFDITLFESALQGKLVENEVTYQLNTIAEESESFDLIVIIRGGGSKLDLSAFDSYKVASAIGHSPLPVWTGIGHEIDESVADLVSNRSLKTPTAVAEAVINHNYNFEAELEHIFYEIDQLSKKRVSNAQIEVASLTERINYLIHQRMFSEKSKVETLEQDVLNTAHQIVKTSRLQLQNLYEQIDLLDPINLLERGLAVLEKNGKRIRSVQDLNVGEEFDINLQDGKIKAETKSIES